MLTLTFVLLVYTVLLKHSHLNIIKATAQRWMLNGTTGIHYRIVFATRAFVKNISVDEVWINNRFYKVNSSPSADAAVHFDNTDNIKVLAIDLNEETEPASNLVAPQLKKYMPGDVPLSEGGVVIVYTTGKKRKYHVIPHVEKLPYAIAG